MLNTLNLRKLKRFWLTKRFLFALFTLFFFNQSHAQPGTLDLPFGPGIEVRGGVHCTSIQNDGKIIVGGQLYNYDLSESFGVVRLNTDGSIDTSFQQGTDGDWVLTTSIQSDGKIIIGGRFIASNGNETHIVRLNSDGSLDNSFNVGAGANSFVNSTSIQSDGKIIIGGRFTSYNGIARNRIARLNSDGSLDMTFDPGTGLSYSTNRIETTAIQSDGKIIIGGWFTAYDGITRNSIARLNVGGSLDSSFDPGTGPEMFNHVTSSAIQSDGKIIIGGRFSSYNGTSRNCVARLNTDGSLDTSFDPGVGLDGPWNIDVEAKAVSVQSDGKIIIGGYFTSYNGTSRKSIARVNTNGSLDTSFDPGTGASPGINTMSIQDDGKIILGGMGDYNGTKTWAMGRIWGTASAEILMEEMDGVESIKIFPNPFKDKTTLTTNLELDDAELMVYNSLGKRVRTISNINGHFVILNRKNLPNGLYFIRFTQGDQIILSDKILIVE